MRPKVVFLQNKSLTNRMFSPVHLEQLSEIAHVVMNEDSHNVTPETAADLLTGADVAVTSWGCPRLTAEVMAHAPHLNMIVHAAGTVKGIVSDAVWDRRIKVGSAAPVLAVGVAETTLGLMITSLKNMWRLAEVTRQGGWRDEQIHNVRELTELTVGIIGAGSVGRHFIKLLQNFELDILVYDPVRSAEEIAGLGAVKAELDALLQRSDVVSIHAPSIPETNHMLNKQTFALMKDDAVLINTARGSIINESDLAAELKKGRFWACIDVTDPEPPPADHPFRTLPNVVLIPHIAGIVNNGHRRLGRYVLNEMQHFVAGKPMVNEVTKEALVSLA